MAHLEDITVGSSVTGVAGRQPVTVVAIKWYGNAVLEITFRDATGHLASQLVYREDEAQLNVGASSLPWGFDADANLLRLTSEAYRIHLAHIFDPYLAVYTSAIESLPHQISAVYQEMLPRLPLRFILADDPGAGKTIMTGLLLKELIVRGDLKRCMIVVPGSLAEQWQDGFTVGFTFALKSSPMIALNRRLRETYLPKRASALRGWINWPGMRKSKNNCASRTGI